MSSSSSSDEVEGKTKKYANKAEHKGKEAKEKVAGGINKGIDKTKKETGNDKGILEKTGDSLRSGYEKTKEKITGEPD